MSSGPQFYTLAITTNSKEEILLVKRFLEPPLSTINGLGGNSILSWFIPVGIQQKGETREECVIRSVLEETGYKVRVLWPIANSLRFHSQLPDIKILKVAFMCKLEDENQVAGWQPPKYIKEVKWVMPEKLKDHIAGELLETCPPPIVEALGIKK